MQLLNGSWIFQDSPLPYWVTPIETIHPSLDAAYWWHWGSTASEEHGLLESGLLNLYFKVTIWLQSRDGRRKVAYIFILPYHPEAVKMLYPHLFPGSQNLWRDVHRFIQNSWLKTSTLPNQKVAWSQRVISVHLMNSHWEWTWIEATFNLIDGGIDLWPTETTIT